MITFVPSGMGTASAFVFAVLVSVLAGYLLQKHEWAVWRRAAAWSLALGVPLILERLFVNQPPAYRMVAIITTLFLGMKAVVGVESRAYDTALSIPRWLMFVALWPGMRPQIFNRERRSLGGIREMAFSGFVRIAVGALMLILAWTTVVFAGPGSGWFWLECALILVGISLIFHFGIIALAASTLRMAGFDCRPLFRAPLESRSLAEFWSRRWNVAFSEMSSLAVYRPVAKRFGANYATLGAFGCSGLFHEMAISWPVSNGYGLPMLYFLIQGAFIILERQLWFAVFAGRWLTMVVVLAPLPILFHPWFLQGIVHPIIQI